MVFWLIVLGLVGVVLFLAWRKDRRHSVTISRRNGAVESDIGGGAMFGGEGSGPHNIPGGGL